MITDKKQETLKQWNNDPCGLVGAEGLDVGTKEFYERVDKNRYEEYAPWMKSVMGFGDFAGKKVLEIGFGMGTDLFQFASHGAEVVGVDLTPRHFEIASERFRVFNMKANLQLADAESLPFPDNTFDAVYTFGVIHHTPDTEKCVREIHRVLKPGGKAIISVYHKNSISYLCTLLLPFLVFRWMFESYSRTLSRIEYRSNSDACPIVKLYTRKTLAAMLSMFSSTNIECHHLDKTHFGRFRFVLPNSVVNRAVEERWGWYLVAKCTK